jgi:tetratricopeptide (TPR) repeat protein
VIYKHLLAVMFLIAALPCMTQTAAPASPKPDSPKPDSTSSYADEAAVVERDDIVYRYTEDDTDTKLETTVMRIQSSAALQGMSVLNFPYATDNQHLEIVYARVRRPDGSVVETPASDAQDQPAQVTTLAPMYSDLHLKQLPVRSLAVGDKLEFQLRLTQRQPEIPGEFWGQESFGAGIIFLERSIELHVPKDKQVTVYSPDHKPDTSETASERVYRWTGSQLRSPTAKNDTDVAKDTKPPIAWTTFPSWAAVGDWYRGLILGRDAVTPAIQAKADELTAQAKTDAEKVQAIYNYVSTHNHYMGIDFGVGRYQPHLASEVMTNQYGDCKDKHTLLAALLRAKGFQVSAVLIGSGIEFNEKVPMPGAFNHVITLVDVGGEKVWLDATTEVAPYRALLSVLRDKEALVIPAIGPAQLLKTPAQLPFPAIHQYEAKSDLDASGSFKGHVEVSMRGDDEIFMRAAARQVARTQWDQLSQAYSNATGANGTTSATALDPPEDLSGPWHMRYDYAQTPFSEWGSYKIGSLLPNINLPSIDEKNPPKKAIELGSARTLVEKSTIRLPAGYGADLPDAVHLKTPYGAFDKTYELKDGSLIAEQRLETLADKVPASDWKAYKKFLDDIGVEPWIQLTAKEHAAGDKGPPLAGESNPVAAELVRQVHDAIAAKDYDLARKKSDQALAVNDKQAYLWSQRGYLAGLHNDKEEAAADYEQEIKQHPENIDQYQGLIYAEGRAGRRDKQRAYLLAYAKAAPTNESAILYVAGTLIYIEDTSDAVSVYRSGVEAIPDSERIKAGLGTALLRTGKVDEGVAVLKPVLEASSDPGVLNDASYVLATHNAELPLAESSARKAVDLLETESRQVVLDGVNAKSFQRALLLIACWDTLGWVYFSEGKIDLAEPYLRAAWKNGAHPEVGLHYGQILEKHGDPKQALRTYEMALSREGPTPYGLVDTELHSRADAIKKRGVTLEDWRPSQVLQDGRTYHLQRPAELKGSATFLAQVSAAETEKVAFLSGNAPLRGEADALSHLNLDLVIPPDSHALLLRSGILFCSIQPTCDFVLTPPESANVK